MKYIAGYQVKMTLSKGPFLFVKIRSRNCTFQYSYEFVKLSSHT